MKPFIFLIGLFAVTACQSTERSFQITFRILDDERKPVTGAKTGVSFENANATKPSERIESTERVTDEEGHVVLGGTTYASGISYGANKAGYYSAYGLRYHFKDTRLLRWQPWNPTIDVVLKRKKNPVPMYAKRVSVEIPASDADIGYDLLVSDWVAPHGKGKIADMIFHSVAEVKSDRNYRGKLTVTFPSQGNGLIPFEVAQIDPSPLRMPYLAPAEGYQAQRAWRSVRRYNSQTMENEEYIDDSSKTLNFFIRARTEFDAKGGVAKAMYGKIHAPFIFDARGIDPWGHTKKQYVAFTYYLNPDGTRNVEYDPKRNLLKSPKREDSDYENLDP